jgi:hypothetical protein
MNFRYSATRTAGRAYPGSDTTGQPRKIASTARRSQPSPRRSVLVRIASGRASSSSALGRLLTRRPHATAGGGTVSDSTPCDRRRCSTSSASSRQRCPHSTVPSPTGRRKLNGQRRADDAARCGVVGAVSAGPFGPRPRLLGEVLVLVFAHAREVAAAVVAAFPSFEAGLRWLLLRGVAAGAAATSGVSGDPSGGRRSI